MVQKNAGHVGHESGYHPSVDLTPKQGAVTVGSDTDRLTQSVASASMDLLNMVQKGDLPGLMKRHSRALDARDALHNKFLENKGTARTAQDILNLAESVRVAKRYGEAIHALTLSIIMKEAPGEAQEIFKAAA